MSHNGSLPGVGMAPTEERKRAGIDSPDGAGMRSAPAMLASPDSRLWDRVKFTDDDLGCWEWQGGLNQKDGYGIVSWRGRKTYVHRLAWELLRGPIPTGLYVCHRCDNPRCVRLSHLFLGTPLDNIRDASAKGRMHPGERHGLSRLTNVQAAEVKALLREGVRGTVIAARFGIHPNTVYHIAKGRSWRGVA